MKEYLVILDTDTHCIDKIEINDILDEKLGRWGVSKTLRHLGYHSPIFAFMEIAKVRELKMDSNLNLIENKYED